MNNFWGRKGQVGDRERNRHLQEKEILLWLKRGPFEINSRLVASAATISHKTFWKKVRALLPPEK